MSRFSILTQIRPSQLFKHQIAPHPVPEPIHISIPLISETQFKTPLNPLKERFKPILSRTLHSRVSRPQHALSFSLSLHYTYSTLTLHTETSGMEMKGNYHSVGHHFQSAETPKLPAGAEKCVPNCKLNGEVTRRTEFNLHHLFIGF